MRTFFDLLRDEAIARKLSPDTLLPVAVQWQLEPLDIFDPAYEPPREYGVFVAELLGYTPPPIPEPEPPPTLISMVVNSPTGLNVRSEPNTTKPRIAFLNNKAPVKVKAVQGNSAWWEIVEANGEPQTGYVSAAYLKAV